MEKHHVRSLFNGIASRYDLLNHLLSGGIDLYWRRRAIAELEDLRPKRILDVATGTADFAVASLKLEPEEVIGVDIAEKMLSIGQAKITRKRLGHRISLRRGDAEHLDFPQDTFDATIVAFGARNFENLGQGLAGMYRVLRPGGRIVVLEFSHPRSIPFRQLYFLYFRHILPRLGRIISSHKEAYTYLPESVMRFPEGADFRSILEKTGFTQVRETRLTGGIATIYTGTK
jgi:demethylmenaquinone methyltransferase/2-methoxy-6-polyprenyl-1,4-benzoquinol methylase